MDALLQRRRHAKRGLVALGLVGVALLATHKGEFWPYSIYPMFSQGGRAWSRSIVRVDDGIPERERWQKRTLGTLPGKPFAVDPHGIPQIDFSEYVDHTKVWDADRIQGLRAMFGSSIDKPLLIYVVHSGQGTVDAAQATPLLRFTPDDTQLGPETRL